MFTDATIDLSRLQTTSIPEVPFIPAVSQLTPDSLVLVIRPDWLTVNLKDGDEVILGRLHPSNAGRPIVDLGRYGGTAYGLSRCHAALRRINNEWWIEDLGSSNGTWLNGERLAPLTPRLLKSTANQIQLANMEISLIMPEAATIGSVSAESSVAALKPAALLSAIVSQRDSKSRAA